LADFSVAGTSAKANLERKLKQLQQAAKGLTVVLDEFILGTNEFLADCDGLFTGVGSGNFYLMDLCRVVGRECMTEEAAERVGCCCGYAPLVNFGNVRVLADTIPAKQKERRLSLTETVTETSICSKAEDANHEFRAEVKSQLESLDRGDLLSEYEHNLVNRYCFSDPVSLCDTFDPADCTVGGGLVADAGYRRCQGSPCSKPDEATCCASTELPIEPEEKEYEESSKTGSSEAVTFNVFSAVLVLIACWH